MFVSAAKQTCREKTTSSQVKEVDQQTSIAAGRELTLQAFLIFTVEWMTSELSTMLPCARQRGFYYVQLIGAVTQKMPPIT